MDNLHSFLIILVIAIVTMLLRFVPVIIFSKGEETPKYITYLGKVLPFAVMGMLIIYCLKDISIFNYSYGLPELISIFLVGLLHIWKKNMLLSVGVSTVFYMILVQMVF